MTNGERETRTAARKVVDALRRLVAGQQGDLPTHEQVCHACRAAGMTRQTFYLLDSRPGIWGYEGDWHACLRRLRNNAPDELVRRACGQE